MKRFISLVLSLIVSTMLYAADKPVMLKDFAYGMPIHLNGMNSMYALTVPFEVYHRVTQPSLADVRVFNGAGEMVTTAIRKQTRATKKTYKALAFFPIYAKSDNLNNLNMKVTHNDNGTIVSVNTKSKKSKKKKLAGYLVDVQAIKRKKLKAILVNWEAKNKNWINQLKISVSNDLNKWTKYYVISSLADLDYEGNIIKRNRIEISHMYYKYMMIQWKNKDIGFAIKNLEAELVEEAGVPLRWRNFSRPQHTHIDREPGEYEYDVDAYIPVTQLNLRVPRQNSLLQAQFYFRNDENDNWTYITTKNMFELYRAGGSVRNEPARVPLVRGRFWKIKVTPANAFGKGVPTLMLGWRPEKIVFLATGLAPFRLAYGSGRVDYKYQSESLLLSKINNDKSFKNIGKATIGPEYVISGKLALKKVSRPTDLKVIILWLVLVIGVAVVAYMVLSLLRQMKND